MSLHDLNGGVPSSVLARARFTSNSGVFGGVVGGVAGGVMGGGASMESPLPVFVTESAGINEFLNTDEHRLSTFGLDVDTASYTIARKFLRDGSLPPPEAVRVEEFVNYFDYGDPAPVGADLALRTEGGPSPFSSDPLRRLLRFNIRARNLSEENRAAATLTFLVDVSGSMAEPGKLALVKPALAEMLHHLRADDQVALVVFTTDARVVRRHTGDVAELTRAIETLTPEDSTNVQAGLELAYKVAREGFRSGTNNRVVLCSDGVANVDRTTADAILELVSKEVRRGIELSAFGFGLEEYNDALLEQLADRGDGRYAYIDHPGEARRAMREQLTGVLQTVAADARAQVEFDPAVVKRYRLVGYENRAMADEKFRDDDADAGEVGAGQSVTVLYEVELFGELTDEKIAALTVRYRPGGAAGFQELRQELRVTDLAPTWEAVSAPLRLSALVAEFAEQLRGADSVRGKTLAELHGRAQALAATLPGRQDIAEFADLIATAAALTPTKTRSAAGHSDPAADARR